jgi:hypothetical protein
MTNNIIVVDYSIEPTYYPNHVERLRGNPVRILEHPKRTDIVQIDVSKIELIPALQDGEKLIWASDSFRQLKEMRKAPLDALALEEIVRHPQTIPESWKGNGEERPIILFPATVFDNGGNRRILFLIWDDKNTVREPRWQWDSYPANCQLDSRHVIACLPEE